MAKEIFGDLNVGRSAKARSFQHGLSVETLTTSRNIDAHDFQYLRLSCASNQDVILPNASTLTAGWNRTIDVASDSVGSILLKTYDAVTPVLLKTLASGKSVKVTLISGATDAGTWKVEVISETETSAAERYVSGFTATTEWGTAAGGYYTITVTAATHGIGSNPVVSVQQLTGSDYLIVDSDLTKIFANGNISIRVPETPDLRFAGRLVIS